MQTARTILILLTIVWPAIAPAPHAPVYEYSLELIPSECDRGSALLMLKGVSEHDSVSIDWNTGQRNVYRVTNLEHGDYSVRIYVRHLDSTIHVSDTTLW